MSGPRSVPFRDKQLAQSLSEPKCDKHKDCVGEKGTKKNPCELIPMRDWLWKRGKLRTGKTASKRT